jgi:SulP family sulfate permease
MRRVPFMDSTGIHNLEVLIQQSQKEGVQIVLSGVNPQVRTALEKAEFTKLIPTENICSNINVALERSKELI